MEMILQIGANPIQGKREFHCTKISLLKGAS